MYSGNRNWLRPIAVRPLLWSAAALGAAMIGCKRETASAPPPQPAQVMFVHPTEQLVTEVEEFAGRTAAANEVHIRSRVSGYLEAVTFEDGQMVEANELLARIDDRMFAAEKDQAEAAVNQYTARLERLKKQEGRIRDLVREKSVTSDEFDQAVSDRVETQALLNGALAARQMAELNLGYTKITAPIQGKISRRLVDPGNLVTENSTILASIVAVKPIYVYFEMDERTVLRLKRVQSEQSSTSQVSPQSVVQIGLADESDFSHSARVDFIDNQVDPATGTLRCRAVVDNDDQFFTPGLFARIRYPIGAPRHSVLVPEEALGSDQGKRFVYTINAQDEIEYKAVATGQLVNHMRVIEEGVSPTERVVVSGLQRIRKGAKVIPLPFESQKPAMAAREVH